MNIVSTLVADPLRQSQGRASVVPQVRSLRERRLIASAFTTAWADDRNAHLGEIDSANRLMLQVMPLVILYLGSRYACVAAR